MVFVRNTVRISQNLLLNEVPVENSNFADTIANYHWSRKKNMHGSKSGPKTTKADVKELK